MSCERFATALKDHAMGAPLDRAAEAHLEACAACRARLEHDRRAMASLDGELAAALAVEPSAGFQAQVRMRVANEPAPARWWPRGWVLVAAAASVVLAIGLLLVLNARRVPADRETPRPDIVLGRENPNPPAPVRGVGSERPKRDAVREPEVVEQRHAGMERVATPRPADYVARSFSSAIPEVIVPPDRAEAIRRYVTAVAQGRVEIPEGALPDAVSSAQEIPPLTVEPVAIPPFETGTSTTTTEVSKGV